MRKLIVGLLMVGGLLAVAAPSMAQQGQGGIGDPLTLAASGVLIPFLNANGDVSLLEVASPVGDNSGMHMFFFDQACNRVGESVGLPATANEITFLQITPVNMGITGTPPTAGLIALGQVDQTGFNLVPLENPIHSRVYAFNTISGRSRVIEPITLDTAEFSSAFGLPHAWNPLRTAATFFAPQETSVVATRVALICPLNTVQGAAIDAFPVTRFPTIDPHFPSQFLATMLRARIYDTNEVLRRDVRTSCACVREDSVTGISNVYGLPEAALGTYTELESNEVTIVGDFPFTGYVATATVGSAVNNFVHRLSNGNKLSIQGVTAGGTPGVTNAR